ncbi:hypothetical protein HY634_02945 [Candidatus Uhrbacteria bacterium]|nr:hypothetical protein [Candidatus Uhrbacteria bacterium]
MGNDDDSAPDASAIPRILVSPSEVDLGAPMVGSEVFDRVTVANIGEGTLHVSRVSVEENDELDEFIASPNGEVDWQLEPGGSMEIEVMLRFEDLEEDHGALVIESNDSENRVTRVPLTSELKGDPEVAICVHEPGWDDPFSGCALEEELRFSVLFGESATLYLTLWNAGTDNRPLEVTAMDTNEDDSFFDLTITDAAGDAAEFPALLNAEQVGRAADHLVVRVDFTGTQNTYVGGVPGEIVDALVIESNEEDRPHQEVPLRARVVCAEGCDGLLCDACCTPTGVESCDGEDNDCNGETDEDPFTELCTDPPASGCLDDGITYRSYGPFGLCIAGECDYTGSMVDSLCDDGFPCTVNTCPDADCVYTSLVCDDADPCTFADQCEDGVCIAYPMVCDAALDAVCEGTNIRIFDAAGACDAGVCEYSSEDIPCLAPENATATCADAVCGFECNDGYAPCETECCVSDHCEEISQVGAPSGRDGHSAVWTGVEMIVWGGWLEGTGILNNGGRYDPVTDVWAPMSADGAPEGRTSHMAFWTSTEMIVWGGYSAYGTPSPSGGDELQYTNTGARYDPETDSWTSMSTVGAPAPGHLNGAAVWTGTEMIVWGGVCWPGPNDCLLGSGSRYDPTTNEWRTMSDEDAPSARYFMGVVWTGTEMIVWGGHGQTASGINRVGGGGRYNPTSDTWSPLPLDDAPPAMEPAVMVWTDAQVVIWSSRSEINDEGPRASALYAPESDTWSPMSVDAPVAPSGQSGGRYAPTVWDGFEALVFPGARYSPSSDVWSAADMSCAVLGPGVTSNRPTAVWLGESAIYWAGTGSSEEGLGFRYWPPYRGD